jgi:tetratricopeptide (TPR) repeat protein
VTDSGGSRGEGVVASQSAPAKPERRRLPGVNLRPGAVRQARQEAGLSLAEVGRGHVTAPAIFLIETGRTRPTLPTLEHIARRTGKPVEFFLADPRGVSDETQDGLVELEGLLAEGRHEEVLELGRRLLSLGSSAHRLGPIRYQIAQAYLQLGKPESAADLLRQAHAHFESVGDRLMLAECIGSEALLAYMNQEPDALEKATRALSIARSMNPVPLNTEARLLAIVAAVHVVNRDWDEAIKHYEEAIEVSGALADLRRLAQMYAGLSQAYRQQGQIEAASRYAVRSVALLEVLRDRVQMARAENELGLILMAKGDRPAARQHLDRSLELSQETQIDGGQTHVLLSLCELSLLEGNIEAAARFAQEALDVAESRQDGAGGAEAHMWLGRVADQQGDDKAVDREFELAIHGLGRFDAGERLLRCHGMYAEILEKRGDLQRAYVHMKKALSASRPGLLRDRSPQAIAWALLIGTFLAERASSA